MDVNQSQEIADLTQGSPEGEATIIASLLSVLKALILAIAAGYLCTYVGIPVGWMIGPLIVGVMLASFDVNSRPLPVVLFTLSQVIIGLTSAVRFSPETLTLVKSFILPITLCILATVVCSMFSGFLLWRLSGLDLPTSLLASIPGASSGIIAMSEEYGAEVTIVAILQYIRVIMLIIIVPEVGEWLVSIQDTNTLFFSVDMPLHEYEYSYPIINWSLLIVCGFLGTLLGRIIRFPAPAFIGSFSLGLIVFLSFPHHFYMPDFGFISGLILLGLATGLKFEWHTIKYIQRAIFIEIILVIALIAICLSIGYDFHLITQVDTMTSLLGFMPGAIDAMVAIVTQLGGDTGAVVAIHMTRQFLILLVVNFLNVLYIRQMKS